MAKRPPLASAGRERRFDAASIARISVSRGEGVVYLDLWHWSIQPDATMTFGEARELIKRLEAALPKATVPDAEDDPYGVG